jgi:eukaryotic-like serine/threonine-protein kinase
MAPHRSYREADVFGGRYVLRRRLGAGAAGVVWLARDTQRDIDVAVKVLHTSVAARHGAKERFASEADLSERMLSPNIVKVLARGFVDWDVPYVVYEHLEGEDLAARLARGGLSWSELQSVIVHACRALGRAHAVGVLHRDVKPENIFLTTDTDGRPLAKMLDFGVAELLVNAKADGDRIVGTLAYAAPEVLLAAHPADARADLYSVGAVAYECVTASLPFAGETLGGLLLAHATTIAAPASLKRPGVGPELDAWFARALAPDRAHRFSSAKEMAEALHGALKESLRQPALDPRTLTPSPRHRVSSCDWDDPARSEPYAFIAPRPPRAPKVSSGDGSGSAPSSRANDQPRARRSR